MTDAPATDTPTAALAAPTVPVADNADKAMDDIVSLCKRRGFVYPASEIYGGLNGFWDYGPLGVQLKNNIRDSWWKAMVECPPIGPDGEPLQLVGLDSSIVQNPKTWVASGHVGGFSDPMQTCRQCKKLVRADHVGTMLKEAKWVQSFAEAAGATAWNDPVRFDGRALIGWAQKAGKKLAPGLALVRKPQETAAALEQALQGEPAPALDLQTLLFYAATEPQGANGLQAPCPNCGGDLTEPREFNLMFITYYGAVFDEDHKAYLRPETAQGIFLNYKNVLDTTRVKVPFGIAQVGKAFRNEVTPRNFIFRSREFEQMEMEWFCHPSEAKQWKEFWQAQRMDWYESLGLTEANLTFREHGRDELSHYAKAGAGTVDIEYRWPFTAPDFGELEGIAHRTDFDLKAHAEHAGTKLDYFDQERNERYVPHVIEPAAGLTRATLAVLCEAYTPTPDRKGSACILKFAPHLAPVKAGIFPLVNKEGMPEVAQKLYRDLRTKYTCEYDAKQSIGKRYARMDEVGTPFCFTIDGQTLEDQSVTVRERDTAAQQRIALDQVGTFLADRIG